MKKIIIISVLLSVYIAGLLTPGLISFVINTQKSMDRAQYVDAYIELEQKCAPIRANPKEYPYGPLGFRCDFDSFDSYITLAKALKAGHEPGE